MKKIFISILSLIFLSSCWDIKQIEEIGFVVAVALDSLSEEEEKEAKVNFQKETGKKPKKMFKTTYQVVIPSALVDSGEKLPYLNISSIGQTNFKMNRQIGTSRSRRLNYEHLKVIIINENLIKNGEIGDIVDFYSRDHEMRRGTIVLIANGEGNEILKKNFPLELMPGISLRRMQENYEVAPGMPVETTIGDLVTSVLAQESYIIPRVSQKGENRLAIAGAAVFLGMTNEFAGWLGEYDVQGYKLIINETGNMSVEFEFEDQLMNFEIDSSDVEMDYKYIDGNDHFKITIKSEGFIVESWNDDLKLSQLKMLERIETAISEEIAYVTKRVIKKMQEEFYTDIFDLHELIEKNDYKRWKSIEDEWDGKEGKFSKATIVIEVKAKAKHYMIIEGM